MSSFYNLFTPMHLIAVAVGAVCPDSVENFDKFIENVAMYASFYFGDWQPDEDTTVKEVLKKNKRLFHAAVFPKNNAHDLSISLLNPKNSSANTVSNLAATLFTHLPFGSEEVKETEQVISAGYYAYLSKSKLKAMERTYMDQAEAESNKLEAACKIHAFKKLDAEARANNTDTRTYAEALAATRFATGDSAADERFAALLNAGKNKKAAAAAASASASASG